MEDLLLSIEFALALFIVLTIPECRQKQEEAKDIDSGDSSGVSNRIENSMIVDDVKYIKHAGMWIKEETCSLMK